MATFKTLIFVLFVLSLTCDVLACSCLWQHPQQQYCNSDYVVKMYVYRTSQVVIEDGTVRLFRQTESRTRSYTTFYTTYEPDPVTGIICRKTEKKTIGGDIIPADDTEQSLYEYKIKIVAVYKGKVRCGSTQLLYSRLAGGCGVVMSSRRYHIIMGSFVDDRMEIGSCSFHLDVHSTSYTNRRYMSHNLLPGGNFASGCDNSCRIQEPEVATEDEDSDVLKVCYVPGEFDKSTLPALLSYCALNSTGACTFYTNKQKRVCEYVNVFG